MMNRHARRRAARMARDKHNRFYTHYVAHLPSVPIDAPFEPGHVHHVVVMHDQWCSFYSGQACNCRPVIRRHKEPRRS
jgi:hypothetical protein